mmetsp:Transcript_20197/g.50980  ORF Transcript_20197/g.50980 Transcript_20197/m.50980 type:complete len:380 (-) Transcript_20197:2003-3142(-)
MRRQIPLDIHDHALLEVREIFVVDFGLAAEKALQQRRTQHAQAVVGQHRLEAGEEARERDVYGGLQQELGQQIHVGFAVFPRNRNVCRPGAGEGKGNLLAQKEKLHGEVEAEDELDVLGIRVLKQSSQAVCLHGVQAAQSVQTVVHRTKNRPGQQLFWQKIRVLLFVFPHVLVVGPTTHRVGAGGRSQSRLFVDVHFACIVKSVSRGGLSSTAGLLPRAHLRERVAVEVAAVEVEKPFLLQHLLFSSNIRIVKQAGVHPVAQHGLHAAIHVKTISEEAPHELVPARAGAVRAAGAAAGPVGQEEARRLQFLRRESAVPGEHPRRQQPRVRVEDLRGQITRPGLGYRAPVDRLVPHKLHRESSQKELSRPRADPLEGLEQ